MDRERREERVLGEEESLLSLDLVVKLKAELVQEAVAGQSAP